MLVSGIIFTVKLVLFLLLLMSVANAVHGQVGAFPDAPTLQHCENCRIVPLSPTSLWSTPWNPKPISNRDVITNKTYWSYIATDVLAGAFDAEMTHEGTAHQDHKTHRTCVEGNHNLPLYPSRWQSYRINIPEQAGVVAFGFLATKLKMPKWILFATIAYPVQAHIRDGLGWYEDCW